MVASLVLAALTIVAASGPAAAPPGPSEITEDVLVRLVQIDLQVLDRNDRPVSDIARHEVRVVEAGVEREVVALERVIGQVGERSPLAGRARVRLEFGVGMPGSSAELDGPDPGRWILLVFDNLNGEIASRLRALEAARTFVRESLLPSDRVAVVSIDRTLHFLEGFTRDHDRILDTLDSPGSWLKTIRRSPVREVTSLINDLVACDPFQMEESNLERILIRDPEACYTATAARYATQRREEALTTLDQLTFLLQAVGPIPDRKYLYFFSEGFSLEPSVETSRILANVAKERYIFGATQGLFGDIRMPLDRFLDTAARAGTTLFAVSTMEHGSGSFLDASAGRPNVTSRAAGGGRAGDPVGANRAARREGLRAIAAAAGGRAYEGNNLVSSLTRAADSTEGLYTLSYRADRPSGSGGNRSLKVRVDRPGVKVLVRSSVSLDLPVAPPVRGHIGLAHVIPRPGGVSRVPVKLELDRKSLRFLRSGSLSDATLSLFAELMDLEGRRMDADFAWVGVTDLDRSDDPEHEDPTFLGFVEVPPGTYWLRVRVAQPDGFSLGVMERFFSVGAQPVTAASH